MQYPPLCRDAMYSVPLGIDWELAVESSIGNWLSRLETSGHSGKPGVTLLFNPQLTPGGIWKGGRAETH